MLLSAVKREDQLSLKEALTTINNAIREKSPTGDKCSQNQERSSMVIFPYGSLDGIMKQVLDLYPDLAAMPDPEGGCLPLHLASSLGDVKVVEILLSKVIISCPTRSSF